MRLILSSVNPVVNKDQLLLLVNTDTGEIDWLPLEVKDPGTLIGTKGMCYSGDNLIASVLTKGKVDKLLTLNVVDGSCNLTTCIKSKNIHCIVSVFKGRLYSCSTETGSMNQIILNSFTNNIIKDSKHYIFDDVNNKVTSLYSWHRRWFAAFYGRGWKNNNFEDGSVIELSAKNRRVYSNLNKPNSIFFNRNDELCFCESGRGLFHYGRNIAYIGGCVRGAIEDRENNGYWIASSYTGFSKLIFLDYDGKTQDEINLDEINSVYSIVKAEGILHNLL